MKFQRVAIALTFVNLALLTFLVIQNHVAEAQSVAAPSDRSRKIVDGQARPNQLDTITPVLRGRALELVDDRGRVRAEIKVLPADPKVKMPDGTTGYPETVLLRLIDSEGGPNVKLAATEDGSGLSLGGEKGYVQILSRGANPLVKLVNKDGREQVIKP
jgi:hypothetical protein